MSLKSVKWRTLAAVLALAASLPGAARAQAYLEGAVFQPQGENLMISKPAGWRLAYMNGDPQDDYVVEFMPANEAHDNWREGYMAVQRRTMPDKALQDGIKARLMTVSQVLVSQVMQNAQRACPGRFVPMRQKDSMTNGIPTSVSGGYCDRASGAPYGEGSVVAAFQGKERMFVVQFSWRPATAGEAKDSPFRITSAKLQQYLDLLNGANLCGGPDEVKCPS